jgi:hypothetical protein
MFKVESSAKLITELSNSRDLGFAAQQPRKHYVKPLALIWAKFPDVWSRTNTIHVRKNNLYFNTFISNGDNNYLQIDDLSRNFAMVRFAECQYVFLSVYISLTLYAFLLLLLF